ncbi:MAG: hypothetical protein ABI473_11465 [Candidatus Dormibacter sp.]
MRPIFSSPDDDAGRVPGAGDPLIDAVTPGFAALGIRPFTRRRPRRVRAGNARLVALSGAVLLVLLPLPYATALFLDVLWRVHYFSALLLIPLLVVKLASTGWRALGYYRGDPGYRADGPPHLMPRLTAPILVAATAVLFGSGIVMMFGTTRFGPWSTIHNGAALIFTGALGLHLLAHLWDTPAEVAADVAPVLFSRPPRTVPGSRRRVALTVAAFVVGLTVAAVAIPVEQWFPSAAAGAHHRDG